MDCWIDGDGFPPLSSLLLLRLSSSLLRLLLGGTEDGGRSLLDQFHVDEHRTSDPTARPLSVLPSRPHDVGFDENDGASLVERETMMRRHRIMTCAMLMSSCLTFIRSIIMNRLGRRSEPSSRPAPYRRVVEVSSRGGKARSGGRGTPLHSTRGDIFGMYVA
jgi:hypothetical protein